MKKIFVLLMSFSLLLMSTGSFAESIDTAKKAKASAKALKAKATAQDKAQKASTAAQDKSQKAAASVSDAKTKAKDASSAAAPAAASTAAAAKTKATTTATQAVNKSADKAIGTDAKGRTIYLGPKGGKYTLSPSGKKVYIKSTATN